MATFLSAARAVVLAVFLVALFAGTAAWLVRTRRISPFGTLGGFLRRASDPLMRPVETRVVRIGGHPAQASFWLILGCAVAGILLLTLLEWIAVTLIELRLAAAAGGREVAAFVVRMAYRLAVAALVVRVVASWFGLGRYRRWLRPVYVLTDWIVEPLRRVVPAVGAIDVTPLVAWLVLWLLQGFILAVLL
jgi:YggT family protein